MKTGDRVVCVKGHSDPACPLKIGKIYIILSVNNCCKCGAITFDIGIPVPTPATACYKCRVRNPAHGIWWLCPDRFAPIEYNSAHDELINKEIVKETPDIPIKEPVHEESKRAI